MQFYFSFSNLYAFYSCFHMLLFKTVFLMILKKDYKQFILHKKKHGFIQNQKSKLHRAPLTFHNNLAELRSSYPIHRTQALLHTLTSHSLAHPSRHLHLRTLPWAVKPWRMSESVCPSRCQSCGMTPKCPGVMEIAVWTVRLGGTGTGGTSMATTWAKTEDPGWRVDASWVLAQRIGTWGPCWSRSHLEPGKSSVKGKGQHQGTWG